MPLPLFSFYSVVNYLLITLPADWFVLMITGATFLPERRGATAVFKDEPPERTAFELNTAVGNIDITKIVEARTGKVISVFASTTTTLETSRISDWNW